MDIKRGIINNTFSKLEVHAINASSFDQEPIDLRNLQKIVEEQNALPSTALDKPQQIPATDYVVVYDKPEYVRDVDKHLEVLKSAKSLFSKRTLTLYHWMYPNIPKQQLKASVASAWENLPITEKHFYISQVLGKFGYPQTSLMLNPQLQNLGTCPSNTLPEANPTTSPTTPTACLFPPNFPLTQIATNIQNQSYPRSLQNLPKGVSTPTSNAFNGRSGHHYTNTDPRSILLPPHQRINNTSNDQVKYQFSVPQYEETQFLEVVKNNTSEGHGGDTAVYEIRLGNGGGTCIINDRMGIMDGDSNNVIIDDNRCLENILVPISMAMRGQNSANCTTRSTRGKIIAKRRGRPPALKRKPVKKEVEEQCINVEDEFQDDPELRKELEQFESTLNMQV